MSYVKWAAFLERRREKAPEEQALGVLSDSTDKRVVTRICL
jgi:hypothetical protein